MSPTAREALTHVADVAYAGGQLAIVADNSSLNQILREVSRQLGMKVTGAVIDERVYGKYGPSAPAEVLASLLKETSSNMLLVETRGDGPAELILTPRQGGVTPPNPSATTADDASAAEGSYAAPTGPAPAQTTASLATPAELPVGSVGGTSSSKGAEKESAGAPAEAPATGAVAELIAH
jgi:hypothetical protein